MKTIRFQMILLLAAMALLAAAPARQAHADDAKVAICSLTKVVSGLQEYKDLTAKVTSDQKDLQQQALEKQNKLKALQDELSLMTPGAAQYAEKNETLLKTGIEYDVWRKMTDLDLARQQKVRTKALFDKIQAMVAQIAAQKSISLVLNDHRDDIPEDIERISVQDLNAIIVNRTVLFSDSKLDITQDVIVALDKAYNEKH